MYIYIYSWFIYMHIYIYIYIYIYINQVSPVLNVVRLPHKMCSHRLSSDVLLKNKP